MTEGYKAGKIRAVGVSNFYPDRLIDFCQFQEVVPAVNQVETHPFQQQKAAHEIMKKYGVQHESWGPFAEGRKDMFKELPLPPQSTTTAENRLSAGIQAQVDIFGGSMKDFWKSGPEESRCINRWLADNCFGDYYTRGGLDYRQREMITFCFLAAQGGCEPQLTSHAAANMKIGNDKGFLIKVISQCLPFIGYPRSLNALRCVNEVCK